MLRDCFFKSKENYLTNQKHIRIIVQYENLGDRMKIQLSKIISVPKYEETVEASIDLNEIKLKGVSYPIREKNDFSIVFRNIRYHLHLRQKSRLEFHAVDVLKK